jgi:glyceraldehyde 3-phosphate dehydrogenase
MKFIVRKLDFKIKVQINKKKVIKMSKVKLGINGFGRIGRIVFRESFNRDNVEVVAINDLLDVEHLAYLLKYDSVHGRFRKSRSFRRKTFVNDKNIRITAEKDPVNLKWNEVDVDVVAECTGFFTTKDTAHIIVGGAK